MEEIWKDIEGYEGLYQVSNMGNVRSLRFRKTNKTNILKLSNDSRGYQRICLFKDDKRKCYLVHRLVAQAFISNESNYAEVNHKDENPSNNRVENLEWCDAKYNVNYGTRTVRAKQKIIYKNGIEHHNSKPICQYTKEGELVKTWYSISDAHRELGFNMGSISMCANGKRQTCGGYIWKYEGAA